MLSADRFAAAYEEALLLHARGLPQREHSRVAGIAVLTLGLSEEWAAQALALGESPDPTAVAAAMEWLAARAAAFVVTARTATAPRLGSLGLTLAEELPALVREPPPPVRDTPLEIKPGSRADFVSVYADGAPPGLAEALVAPADVADPAFVHLVGFLDGTPVGCAMVRVTSSGLGYVSAVTVRASVRGRGYGAAMTLAAAATAGDRGCQWVGMHATSRSLPLYRRLGFEVIDTHVHLRPNR